MTTQPLGKDRRPIKSRNTQWAQKFTSYLVKINASPNKISVWSIFFSIVGAYAIVQEPDFNNGYDVTVKFKNE